MRVLIAVDGTEHSVTVAQTAYHLFGDSAEYLVLNCAQVPVSGWGAPFGTVSPMAAPMMPGDTSGLIPVDVEGSTQLAQSHAEEVVESSDLPAAAESIGDIGDPVMTIIESAHKHEVDVIVLGHADRSWFARVVEGSVSKEVIRESDIPVLVIPFREAHHHKEHKKDHEEAHETDHDAHDKGDA